MPRKPKKPAANGKLAKMMGKRLSRAHDDHKTRIARGDVYGPSIHGDPPTLEGKDGAAKVARQEKEIGRNWSKTTVPKNGEVRQLLKPALVNKAPTWENEHPQLPPGATDDQKKMGEYRRKQRRLYEELARVIYREFRCHRAAGMAVDDAMQYGKGACITDWNGNIDKPLCGFKYVSIKRVLVDSETMDDPLGESQRWKACCYTMPLGDAKKLAADMWDNPEYEFKSASTELGSDENGMMLDELPTRFVKIVMVYVHGDSPHLRESRMDAELGEEVEEVGEDEVYDGRDHVLVMEARGEFDDPVGYSLIARLDPMYPCDHGDDPLTLFSLDPDNEEYWGKPIYQKGHSLQVAINWALRTYNTDAFLSTRRGVGIVKGALDPSEEEKLLARTEPLPIVQFNDQNKLQNGMKPIDFGRPNPALADGYGINSGVFDNIMSADLFRGVGKSHETAARAMLSSERAQLVIGSMADMVEEWLTVAMRKALMACRAKMTAEQVAAWIGNDFLEFVPKMDEKTGETVNWSPLWNDEVNDIESIRMEVEIRLKPRSVRFTSPEQRLQDMDRLTGKMLEFAGKVIEANQINPKLAVELARVGNNALRAYGEMLNLPYADEMTIDLRVAATPPQPSPDVMAQGQQQQAQMAGDMQMQRGEQAESRMEAMMGAAGGNGGGGY